MSIDARWARISPFLDEALALPEDERAGWLDALRGRHPEIADDLGRLLDAQRELVAERFLESGPSSNPREEPTLAGRAVGAYTLVEPIGQGGMGSVWLAKRTDGRFERQVAVKFLRISVMARGGEARFTREGRILAQLRHPHIAQLLDAGVMDGQPFLVLEHVDGEPIDDYCDSRALDVEARLRLFLDILGAVADAHAHLVVHRDLKPSNVLVTAGGAVKLLDFGIAKLSDDGDGMSSMDSGFALTPEYAAPEQVTGGVISTATDVYALGILLYVLLSGHHPAGAARRSPADMLKAIVDTEPPRLSQAAMRTSAGGSPSPAASRGTTPDRLGRRLRGDLDTIVAKAMKKEPGERYASVTSFADDIRRYLNDEPIGARPDAFAYRAAKFVRRNRTVVAFAVLALIAIVGGAAGTLVQARTAREQRDFAIRQLSSVEAVSDLNQFLLTDAAPSGEPFTVNDLLRAAERIVRRQDASNGAIRVEQLVSLGRQWWSQDEHDAARRLLDEAYTASRGLTDPSVRARAACSLASVVARDPDPSRAIALTNEGLGLLPGGTQFTLDRVYCMLRASEVARIQVEPTQAIAHALAARRLLEASPIRSDVLDLRILMDLAESYRTGARFTDAIAAFEQASVRLAALGRDQTATAGTLLNNWALTLGILGRPRDSEPLFRKAIEISRADATEDAVSPMLLINEGRALRDLARYEEALGYAERGLARARVVGHEAVVDQSLMLMATIHREMGHAETHASLMREIEPRWRQMFPDHHVVIAALLAEQALGAQARGERDQALTLIDRALGGAEGSASSGGPADLVPVVLMNRSAILLDLGRAGHAAADAQRAVQLFTAEAGEGVSTSYVGRSYLALGRARSAEGRRADAQAALRTAAAHLESAVGGEHPLTRQAKQLLDAER